MAATTALTSSSSAVKISSTPSASRIQRISRITTRNVVSVSNIGLYLSRRLGRDAVWRGSRGVIFDAFS
jgi:hypothetical protein